MITAEPKIAMTGGIACGKSLLSRILKARGFEIMDADDIVHSLIPDPEERKRLAAEVFRNPAKRRELESRIHPQVRSRISKWIGPGSWRKIAVVPLLFEVKWDEDFDIILCVASSSENQIGRMTAKRGYTAAEAKARMDSQMSLETKTARSHYTIHNDSGPEDLEREADKFVAWLAEKSGR